MSEQLVSENRKTKKIYIKIVFGKFELKQITI